VVGGWGTPRLARRAERGKACTDQNSNPGQKKALVEEAKGAEVERQTTPEGEGPLYSGTNSRRKACRVKRDREGKKSVRGLKGRQTIGSLSRHHASKRVRERRTAKE